jgi:hypothetical protein
MLELGTDKSAAPDCSLLIAKISEDRLLWPKAKPRGQQPCFWLLGPERHAEGRDPFSGPKRPFIGLSGYRSHPGARKATLRGRFSTLRGLRGPPVGEATVRIGPDLDSCHMVVPQRSFVIAVLEGAGDHRFSSRVWQPAERIG